MYVKICNCSLAVYVRTLHPVLTDYNTTFFSHSSLMLYVVVILSLRHQQTWNYVNILCVLFLSLTSPANMDPCYWYDAIPLISNVVCVCHFCLCHHQTWSYGNIMCFVLSHSLPRITNKSWATLTLYVFSFFPSCHKHGGCTIFCQLVIDRCLLTPLWSFYSHRGSLPLERPC